MSATQWSYNGCEGIVSTVLSAMDLLEMQPRLLLPSHGEVMHEPAPALELLVDHLKQLLQLRGQYAGLEEILNPAFVEITPHLIWNTRSFANSYALLSKSGKALLIDFGYPNLHQTFYAGTDRASRRPGLRQIQQLKQRYRLNR